MSAVMGVETTLDRFLGGRLTIEQPRRGYRAGIDPVMLAAAIAARPGERVLELGCGAGTACLCLASRVQGLDLHGLEMQETYAAMARENAARNGVALGVWHAALGALPAALNQIAFDHVLMNPPYHTREATTRLADGGRDLAFREMVPLAEWLDVAARRLRQGGLMTLIQRAERLPEVLAAASPAFGTLRALPIAARHGRPAGRVIVTGVKGGKGAFRLLSPLIVHEGGRHEGDGEDYTEIVARILRDGEALVSTQG